MLYSARRSRDRNDHEDETWSGWDSDAWSSSEGEEQQQQEEEQEQEQEEEDGTVAAATATAGSRASSETAVPEAGASHTAVETPLPLAPPPNSGVVQQKQTLVPVGPLPRGGDSASGAEKPKQGADAGSGWTTTQSDQTQKDLLARIEALLSRQPVAVEEAAALYQEYIVCEASMMGAHKKSKKVATGEEPTRVSEELRNAAAVLTGMMYRA